MEGPPPAGADVKRGSRTLGIFAVAIGAVLGVAIAGGGYWVRYEMPEPERTGEVIRVYAFIGHEIDRIIGLGMIIVGCAVFIFSVAGFVSLIPSPNEPLPDDTLEP